MAKRRKLPFYAISAVTGEGIEALKYAIAEMVAEHRPVEVELKAPQAEKLKPALSATSAERARTVSR